MAAREPTRTPTGCRANTSPKGTDLSVQNAEENAAVRLPLTQSAERRLPWKNTSGGA